jgi:hypothetical protein
VTDPHQELRDNVQNIDPAWQGEIQALLNDHDRLSRTLRVEQGDVSAAVEGWVYLPKVPTEMWAWNGPVTGNVRPVIIRGKRGQWELHQNPQGTGVRMVFSTALEAMLAEPPWDALEDAETQETMLF